MTEITHDEIKDALRPLGAQPLVALPATRARRRPPPAPSLHMPQGSSVGTGPPRVRLTVGMSFPAL